MQTFVSTSQLETEPPSQHWALMLTRIPPTPTEVKTLGATVAGLAPSLPLARFYSLQVPLV